MATGSELLRAVIKPIECLAISEYVYPMIR